MSVDTLGKLGGIDPFADEGADGVGDSLPGGGANYVHIRNQQRNGRKSLTTIQGLSTQFDYKKLLKAFKKNFNCNGTIVDDPELGHVIQVQGDHRHKIAEFLISEGLVEKEHVKVHGA
ncbi:unnamed protein product [Vitrella brassicaformis CCMP3155]|uniref:SUI1 domain-containing protein n=2 Tax=Vitrella brassicaformis TaxID=1169539 RepID=A0A0G4EFU8_VITBC|nr:unnamed protein product [Vitrella brassicaformis CCMP3155]|mmetsp:Transcript_28261/g.70598  ORF Transcript_28261/g.70598 Transcript_28261/m.70598 type:complete len:118 (+) Transcript_28261:169-522(+)|eukprot:CEL94260.1 unnamed protein product [Vitrella brassicaformis CCMP3155]